MSHDIEWLLTLTLQNPEEAVKEFMADKPILTEIEQQIKYYQVININKLGKQQNTQMSRMWIIGLISV